jgi:hypothetical protein
MFTEAFRGDAFTLGYHATSGADTANHMLKSYLPQYIRDLTQIREPSTHAYQIKALAVKHQMERPFRWPHFLRELYNAPVARTVCKLIEKELRKGKKWQIIPSNDNSDDFVVINDEQATWRITMKLDIPLCQ